MGREEIVIESCPQWEETWRRLVEASKENTMFQSFAIGLRVFRDGKRFGEAHAFLIWKLWGMWKDLEKMRALALKLVDGVKTCTFPLEETRDAVMEILETAGVQVTDTVHGENQP